MGAAGARKGGGGGGRSSAYFLSYGELPEQCKSREWRESRIGRFGDLDSRVCQAVPLVDESVNLAIRGVDLALEHGLFLRRLGGGEFSSFPRSAWERTFGRRSTNTS